MVSDVSKQGATVRTTLDVDRKLLDEVVKATGERSKIAAVNKSLEEYVRRTKTDQLRTMAGKILLDDTRAEQREEDRHRRVAQLRSIAGNIDLVDNLKELEALELEEYRNEVHL